MYYFIRFFDINLLSTFHHIPYRLKVSPNGEPSFFLQTTLILFFIFGIKTLLTILSHKQWRQQPTITKYFKTLLQKIVMLRSANNLIPCWIHFIPLNLNRLVVAPTMLEMEQKYCLLWRYSDFCRRLRYDWCNQKK